MSRPTSPPTVFPLVGLITALTTTTEPITITLCAMALLIGWHWLR